MEPVGPQGSTPADHAPPRRGLVGNSALLLGSRLVVAVLGWAGTLFVVRALTPDEWGRFTFVFGLLGLLSFASELGSNRVVLRRLAHGDVDRASFAGTYVLLRSALGVVAYLAALCFVVVGGYPRDVVVTTAIAGTVLLFGAPSGGLNAIYEHSMNLKPVAVASVLGQVVQFGLTGVVAVTRPTLLVFVLPAIAFDVVELLWKLRCLRGLVRLRYRIQLRVWRDILREALPLALGSGLALLYPRLDLVLLSKLADFEAVGRYGIALKFVVLAGFLPYALTTSLLPVLLAHRDDPVAYRAVVRRATALMAVTGGAVMVLFLPVAGDAISTLYGESYRVAANAARVVVAGACLGYFSAVALTVLTAAGRLRVYVYVGLLGLAVNATGQALLIPRYSYEGAAVATACTGVTVAVVLVVAAQRVPEVRTLGILASAPVLLAIAAGLGTGALLAPLVPWPAAAAAAALVYAAALHVLRVGGPDGLRALFRDEPAP